MEDSYRLQVTLMKTTATEAKKVVDALSNLEVDAAEFTIEGFKLQPDWTWEEDGLEVEES